MLRKVIELSSGWRYRAVDESSSSPPTATSIWRTCRSLPTEIHLDLLNDNLIPDPFIGKNEEALQWVGETKWEYETNLTVPADALVPESRTVLVMEGLDTFATVTLNGKPILQSANAFMTHRVGLTRDMFETNEGSNLPSSCNDHDESSVTGILRIVFANAEQCGLEIVKQHAEHGWFSLGSSITRLATRKPQYHYGWDWGPKIMTCGPWRPIYVEYYTSRIADVAISSSLSADLQEAIVEVSVEVDGLAEHFVMDLLLHGNVVHHEVVPVRERIGRIQMKLATPQLWWPHSLGPATMYSVQLSLYATQDAEFLIVDQTEKSFGIRKVELVQRGLEDQDGDSFFFKVNNIPIFAAGSCWIPADSFLSRISPRRYQDWIQLARDCNQNMIRVWGGGIYENPAFYEACDRQGMLVWQDFMFACGSYPVHEEFRRQIVAEAEQNVRRLRHHPCLVLWCGNNEDYVIYPLRGIQYDATETSPEAMFKSILPARYFYEHVLPTICADLNPGTPYWPGSPFGGAMVNSPLEGDIHQWHVWHFEMFPYQDFSRLSGRFVSEFGMQALPCLETAKEFFPVEGPCTASETDVLDNQFLKWHNKMADGHDRLRHYGRANISFGTSALDDVIYNTQLIQAEAVATAYRSWRRLWQGPGKEYCSGALVWQLNDCWPVTSWAIVDYHLRPKMAYWAMKRECAFVTGGLSRITKNGGALALDYWAVNMTQNEVKASVTIRAWLVGTGEQVLEQQLHDSVSLQPNRSVDLGILGVDDLKLPTIQQYRDIVFALVVELTETEENLPKTVQAVNFHDPLREVPFPSYNAKVDVAISQSAAGISVRARATVPMKGLLFEVDGDPNAKWDDNGIDLIPGQIAELRYLGQGLRPGQESRLRARWLGGSLDQLSHLRPSL
ncbi:hypothetical protein PV08_11696 [Exophiala spinifera]|uniref:Beta-mannosidase B n=1 Tax=Exophiala spinifera TaxID=91928 RepID=A0A0D2ATV3_9EURO|nr:uncharacterized protein PV08_11696 [Exophiala spinifera]KIW09920.1 hypothetical protein PV08_11696 [Exophiala spinifera]